MNNSPSKFTFDATRHLYELDGKPLTGVTTVLSVIAKPALIQWAANEAIKYIEENGEYFQDRERWIVSPAILEAARKAHTKKKEKAGAQGTDTHTEIEKYVKTCIERGVNGLVFKELGPGQTDPLVEFSKWAVSNNIKFIESEKRMYSREWWVAGTTDLVFEKDGQRFVGDVKTMKKLWDVTPFIQCAAYAKMMSESGEKFDGTCIINIPKETNRVETHYRFDLEGDTRAFEAALTLYRTLNS